jgi:hypothetical protein
MKAYDVTFNTQAGTTTEAIHAATPQQALGIALKIKATGSAPLAFRPYHGTWPVQEIVVIDKDGNECCGWMDDDVCFQQIAYGLLEAARELVAQTDAAGAGHARNAVKCLIEALDQRVTENHALARNMP